MPRPFHVRPASVAAGDGQRLLDNFDSQLPWLATLGSGQQWGSNPRGSEENFQTKYLKKVQRSEACLDQPFDHEWIRAYVAEIEVHEDDLDADLRGIASQDADGELKRVPVAAMILEAKSADYVRSLLPEQDNEEPFIYLSYLLSDRRTATVGKGAGAVLIAYAKDEARKLGLSRICADCWRGRYFSIQLML